MVNFPNSKINIGLNILSKRTDGFHNIETVFYPLDICDMLEFVELPNSKDVHLSQSGIIFEGHNEDNICLKAYRLMQREYDLPGAKIHLHKVIPVGAGLGGGSSDAASMINMLNDWFKLGISLEKRVEFASILGSDCSFFIHNKPCFAEGRGEVLTEISLALRSYYLVLIKPAIHVNTAEAYKGVVPNINKKSLREIIQLPVKEWKENITNDFESTVFLKYPEIGAIKEKLYSLGSLYASMSGSGSSVYGIFTNIPRLNNEFENCFVWQGFFK